jgi:peptidoglycan/xylan/chitin deacetylase (PgdA/CDA1 family)
MYHAIVDESTHDPEQATVSLPLFSRQMEWLATLNCRVVPLREGVARLAEPWTGCPLVCLTFDDGYRSTYTHAFPVLERHRFPATVFLVPGTLNGTAVMSARYGPFLTWAEAREMQAHDIAFGAHGMTHRKLSRLPDDVVAREIHDSRRAIEDVLSTPVTEFAYPFGSFDSFTPSTERIVRRAGFTAICTTIAGHNRVRDDAFRLKRLRISWADASREELRRQYRGAYNWYAWYQRFAALAPRELL